MKVYIGLVNKVSLTTYSQGEAYAREYPIDEEQLVFSKSPNQIVTVAFVHGLLEGYFKQFGSYQIAKSKIVRACWHRYDQKLVEDALRRCYGFSAS